MADVPPELAAEVQKLERYHSENPQGRYFVPLANAYRKMGEVEQAEALLREGLRRHPDYLSAHIVLGRCLADRGAVADATGEFRYVLSVDPQNLIALRSLGELASESGHRDEAVRWYRELLAVDPMNDEARVALESLQPPPAGDMTGGWGRQEEAQDAGGFAMEEGLQDVGAFGGGLEWGNLGETAAAPAESGAPDEMPSWGEITLDTGAHEEEEAPPGPVADSYDSLDFGGVSLSDAAAPEPEPAPWSVGGAADGGWDPMAGGTIDLDTPAFEPAEEEEEEVVTETIAELYARQGFHDRAADVYRELIRRRGGDPVLEQRLREVEQRAAGGEPQDEAPVVVEPVHVEPEPVEPADEIGAGLVGTEIEPLPGIEDPATPTFAFASHPTGDVDDAFAASFEDGFGEAAERSVPAAAASVDPGFVLPELTGDFAPAPEEPAAPEPAYGAPAGAAPSASGGTVREYLSALVSWRPGVAPAQPVAQEPVEQPAAFASEPAYEAPAPAPEPAPVVDEDDDMPWLAAPVSEDPAPVEDAGVVGIEGLLTAETRGAADEDPYPWEVAAPQAPPAPEPAAEPETRTSAFSFEEFFLEEAEPATPAQPAPVAEQPSASAAEPPRAEPPAAPAAASDDDEDLESFQAWLQSLKR